jgi:signal transduction histidine kinase
MPQIEPSHSPLVLVTDDEEAARYAVTRMLELAGFRTVAASSLAETRQALTSARPDALVLDVNLPDGDGRALCRQLRAEPATARLPVVQVSATHRAAHEWAEALDSGADVFLPQPVDDAVLAATLRALLRSREAERRLEETLASITEAYIAFDADWRLLEVNHTAETEIFRRPAAEVVGKILWDEYPGARDSVFGRNYLRARTEGVPVHFEGRSDVDGGRWYEAHVYPRGERTDIYLHDITARKSAEEERARLLEEAQRANRVKDEFLATLSHELRTPMNAIVGWTAVLSSGSATREQMERAVQVIHRNVMAQNQLISDLLDVSRIVTGKLRLDVRPVIAAEPVRAALETVRPAAEGKGVRVHPVLDTGLVVTADPDRLQQIAWNLLSNAVKFTPRDGHIHVSVGRTGSAMELVVADSGAGIDPAFLPHVFERFRQDEGSGATRQVGLGLGLAIARHLAELHGGTVEAASPGRDQGATFTVRLPLPSVTLRTSSGASAASVSLDGVSVLVVDDDADSREIAAVLLRRAGARVAVASSVKEAMAELEKSSADVVISDLDLPQEDGYALAAEFRRRQPASRVPLVALSAHAGDADRRRSLDAGFAVHLTKPVDESELVLVTARMAGIRPLE